MSVDVLLKGSICEWTAEPSLEAATHVNAAGKNHSWGLNWQNDLMQFQLLWTSNCTSPRCRSPVSFPNNVQSYIFLFTFYFFLNPNSSKQSQALPKIRKGAQLQRNEVSNVCALKSTLARRCLSNTILQMAVLGCVVVNYNDSLFLLSKHSCSLEDEMLESEAWC